MKFGKISGAVAGWGIDSISHRPSQRLMHIPMPTVNRTHCWETFQAAARHYNFDIQRRPLSDYKFCAGSK